MARHPFLGLLKSTLWSSKTLLSHSSKAQIPIHRQYSIQSNEAAIKKLSGINPDLLSITTTNTPKDLVPPEELVFGRTFTGIQCYSGNLKSKLDSLNTNNRSYAINRMDSCRRVAPSTNYPLPKPKPRPGHLRFPLCLRMLRGDESLQERHWANQSFQARQEHVPSKQILCAHRSPYLRAQRPY